MDDMMKKSPEDDEWTKDVSKSIQRKPESHLMEKKKKADRLEVRYSRFRKLAFAPFLQGL